MKIRRPLVLISLLFSSFPIFAVDVNLEGTDCSSGLDNLKIDATGVTVSTVAADCGGGGSSGSGFELKANNDGTSGSPFAQAGTTAINLAVQTNDEYLINVAAPTFNAFSVVGGSSKGTVSSSGTNLVYTPPVTLDEVVQVTYSLAQAGSTSASASVYVDVDTTTTPPPTGSCVQGVVIQGNSVVCKTLSNFVFPGFSQIGFVISQGIVDVWEFVPGSNLDSGNITVSNISNQVVSVSTTAGDMTGGGNGQCNASVGGGTAIIGWAVQSPKLSECPLTPGTTYFINITANPDYSLGISGS